ncbi:MAG: site-specific integrase [Planctomycetia bacterium]|nr:site-specific integrase [Planctomycetia bacterium]
MARSSNAPAVPACFEHKATGQAVVKLAGRFVYLGAFGSDEALQRYRRVIAEWQAKGCWTPEAAIVVKQVIAGYWRHAEVYYRKNGKPTSELSIIKPAMRVLNDLYGDVPATAFGPLALKACREAMIGKDLCRTTINGYVSRIKQAFRWAVENELVPAPVHQALLAVPGLKRGRTLARESAPVRPVDGADMEAVLPFVARQVAAMIRLQWLTGMRPQEVVQMRMGDIDRGGRVWIYRPTDHKVEHHGMDRVVPLGPQAQEVLVPFLKLDPVVALFSPREAEKERRAAMRAARKSKVWPSHSNRARKVRRGSDVQNLRDCYDTASYRRAVDRGCEKAGLPSWSPNQLRHSAATRIRKEMGCEVAQAVLGHRQLETTQVYAEVNQARAVEAMERLG